MIRRVIAVTSVFMACGFAHAQSAVTMYGVLDIGPVFRTHVNAAGDHSFSLGDRDRKSTRLNSSH